MTSRDFAYWLQGFFEITDPSEITPEQVQMIRRHLNMVFVHEIDPSHGDVSHQAILNELHNSHLKPTGQPGGEPTGLLMRC